MPTGRRKAVVTDTLAAADADGEAAAECVLDVDAGGVLCVLGDDAWVDAPLQPDSIVTAATPSAAT